MRIIHGILALGLLLVLCGVPAQAQKQYQTQIVASYNRNSSDRGSRFTFLGLTASQYFEPVKTDGHPYAEAAFLERIGSVFAMANHEEFSSGESTARGQTYSAGVEYARPASPLVLAALYSAGKNDGSGSIVGQKTSAYNVAAGYFLTKTLLASLGYSHSKFDFASSSLRLSDYTLFAKYVRDLERDKALSLSGFLTESRLERTSSSSTNTEAFLAVDYFFNRSLSAGAGILNNWGENRGTEGRTYLANLRIFFTPWVGSMIRYDRFQPEHADVGESESFGVDLGVRF
jgi:hypothetical protein